MRVWRRNHQILEGLQSHRRTSANPLYHGQPISHDSGDLESLASRMATSCLIAAADMCTACLPVSQDYARSLARRLPQQEAQQDLVALRPAYRIRDALRLRAGLRSTRHLICDRYKRDRATHDWLHFWLLDGAVRGTYRPCYLMMPMTC